MHVSLVNDGPVTLTIDDELDENQKNKSKDKKKWPKYNNLIFKQTV